MASKATAKISRTIIFCKELEQSSILYTYCLGMRIVLQGQNYLELTDSNNYRLVFCKGQNFAQQTKGYSPIIQFQVDNIQQTIDKLIEHGAQMEGQISKNDKFQVCVFQGINGEMLSIYQGDDNNSEYKPLQDDQNDDPTMNEIKQILRKLQL